jgi:hypothetical protein
VRRMLDALYPDDIPLSYVLPTDLIAGYLGHASNPQSYQQAVDRFPNNQIVSIASHNAVDAQILDIENGAVDPGDYTTINTWNSRQLARGVYPSNYCNESTWPLVYPHLTMRPNWWAADWNKGPVLPGAPYPASGVQYTGLPGFDISTMLDFIEGIDTVSEPFTPAQLAQIENACVNAVNAAILPTIQELYLGPPTDLSQAAYQAGPGAALWAAYQANIGSADAQAAYENGYNAWYAWGTAAAKRWNLQTIGAALKPPTPPVPEAITGEVSGTVTWNPTPAT